MIFGHCLIIMPTMFVNAAALDAHLTGTIQLVFLVVSISITALFVASNAEQRLVVLLVSALLAGLTIAFGFYEVSRVSKVLRRTPYYTLFNDFFYYGLLVTATAALLAVSLKAAHKVASGETSRGSLFGDVASFALS